MDTEKLRAYFPYERVLNGMFALYQDLFSLKIAPVEAPYQRPQEKIPQEIIAKMKEAKLATYGTYYRRQLSFGLLDLTLHGPAAGKRRWTQ